MGFGVQGVGSGVWGVGFGVLGLGLEAWGLGPLPVGGCIPLIQGSSVDCWVLSVEGVEGVGFRVQGVGCRVQSLGLRV